MKKEIKKKKKKKMKRTESYGVDYSSAIPSERLFYFPITFRLVTPRRTRSSFLENTRGITIFPLVTWFILETRYDKRSLCNNLTLSTRSLKFSGNSVQIHLTCEP